tara:strand:- start:4701 stop:7484 length:2784 start_codon:yes stop_codon:yes gene_type:complete
MGTSGHMQHPFDIPSVKTGQDLINYFERIVEHLSANPGSVKFDGINVSFKLVDDESTPTGKDFRMDRGTSAPESVIGMTAADAYKKWPEGHGMPPAIDELLKIFNEALPLIEPELKALGMWDDPTKYFNTEYMKKGRTNVVEYGEKILALHGVNQFYEKKAQAHRIKKGIGMDRPGLERPIDPETGKPTKHGSTEVPYDSGVLQSIIEKVKPIAEQHEVSLVGDVSTEISAEVDFSETLSKPFTINMTDTESETHSLGEWLSSAVNPFDAKVQKRDGKQAWAISKEIYFAVLNGVPLMEMLETPEDVKTAINGALFNHATHELGMDVKRASTSSKGGLEGHEGIVIRGIDDRPVKVTGDFIVKGAGGAIKDKIKASKEKETLAEIADEPIDLEFEIGDNFEEEPVERKMVAIYPGRFQPMGRHHAEVYKALLNDERFDDVFISTSDKVEMPKSPFNFKEKQEIAAGHDIDPSKIVQTKNPYNAVEITNSLDPETVVVYFVGCKDMDADPNVCDGTKPRFPRESLGGMTKKGTPRYFRAFEDEEDFKGVKDHAYIAVAPHIEIEIPELGEMSGTTIRQALQTAEPEKFESIMGFYDPVVYDMIKSKLNSEQEELQEVSQLPLGIFLGLIEEVLNEVDPVAMYGANIANVPEVAYKSYGTKQELNEIYSEDYSEKESRENLFDEQYQEAVDESEYKQKYYDLFISQQDAKKMLDTLNNSFPDWKDQEVLPSEFDDIEEKLHKDDLWNVIKDTKLSDGDITYKEILNKNAFANATRENARWIQGPREMLQDEEKIYGGRDRNAQTYPSEKRAVWAWSVEGRGNYLGFSPKDMVKASKRYIYPYAKYYIKYFMEELFEVVDDTIKNMDAYASFLSDIWHKMSDTPIEQKEDLEEISAMGAGAVEGGGRTDEQEGLIREVEDYLYKLLGVTE